MDAGHDSLVVAAVLIVSTEFLAKTAGGVKPDFCTSRS